MVLFAIRLQEEAGLDVVSDGEWRRVQYVDEFLLRIGGFEKIRPFEHAGEKKFHLVVNHRMGAEEPVFYKDAQLHLPPRDSPWPRSREFSPFCALPFKRMDPWIKSL